MDAWATWWGASALSLSPSPSWASRPSRSRCCRDYGAIGIAAPISLVAIRILQGFAIGGEYGGAAIYVAEHASAKRRGFATGWIQAAASMGLALALVVILVTREEMGEDTFAAWGWRVPFAASIVLLAVSLWIRLSLEESPLFRRIQEEGRTSKAPLSEAFLEWRNLKLILIALAGVLAGQGVVWYTAQFYMQVFLERVLKVDGSQVNILILVVTLSGLPLYILFSWLSDIIGRKPVMLAGLLLAAAGFIPGFQMLTEAANPKLAAASAHSPVTVTADAQSCALQFDPVGKAKFTSSCDIAKSALTGAGIPYSNVAAAPGALATIHVGSATLTALDGSKMDTKTLAATRKTFEAQLKPALAAAGLPFGHRPDQRRARARADHDAVHHRLRPALRAAGRRAGRAVPHAHPLHRAVGALSHRRRLVRRLPARDGVRGVCRDRQYLRSLWYPVIVAGIGFVVTLFFVPETKGRAID